MKLLVYVAGALAVLACAMSAAAASAALTVTITGGPSGTTTDTTATFEFGVNVRDARFTCSLDGASAAACSSPKTYRALAVGTHEFVVTAVAGRETGRAGRSWKVEPTTGPPPTEAPIPYKPCVSGFVVICFDDLVPGTVVSSQYAAEGVELGYTATAPTGGAGSKASIAADSGAWSDGQVLRAWSCGGDIGCPGHTVDFRFTFEHHVVRVRAGGGDKITLTALGGSGNQLAQQTKQTTQSTLTLLEVTSVEPIMYLTISGSDAFGSFTLDNLEFDPPDPNAKPDFGLAWIPPWGDDKLSVAAGSASSAAIFITRFNGSTGAIEFVVSGLPSGVTASVSPSVANTATTSVLLTVTASVNATTGGPPIPISVIGHPSNSLAGYANHSVQIPLLLLLGNFDARVSGIEVNQGIQSQVASYYNGSSLSPTLCKTVPSLAWTNQNPFSVPYDIAPTSQSLPYYVPLVAHRPTVVRAYANLAYPSTGSLAGVKMLLYGYVWDQPLPGSPLSPDTSPVKLTPGNPWATCADRADPNAYTFTLPDSWTEGQITLKAKIFPDDVVYGPGDECGTQACKPNNEQKLRFVTFQTMPTVTVTPVLMSFSNASGPQFPGNPASVFSGARYFSPSPLLWFNAADGWYGLLVDVQDEVDDASLTKSERCGEFLDKLEDALLVWTPWSSLPDPTFGLLHGNATVGVSAGNAGCPGATEPWALLPNEGESFSVVNASKRVTSVTHELFHGFGRVHADTACGGNSGGQVGQLWPPDQRGQIHGIGLDTRIGSGPGSAPYAPIVPGALLTGTPTPLEWIDFMSYCVSGLEAPGSNKNCASCAPWISVDGWRETVAELTNFGQNFASLRAKARRLQRGSESESVVRVSAIADGSDVRILGTRPGVGTAQGDVVDYQLVVRNGAGGVVGQAPLRGRPVTVHGERPAMLLAGVASTAGAASIEIVRNGIVLARRLRTAHAPSVDVLAPRAGARAGRGRTVVVSWKATDVDSGSALEAKIDYSTDGGTNWRPIYSGPNRGRVALPSTLFGASHHARVRVRVSDGWNTADGVSAPFLAEGRAPSVRISAPTAEHLTRRDTALNLAGGAYDDLGHAIEGKRLRWFDNGKRVAGGAHAVVFRPTPGEHTIRLLARDSRGRVGGASVRIRVLAVAPHLLDLRSPAYVSRRATRLSFAVATTIPATLTAGGRRYAVGRTMRRITVPIHAGGAIVFIRLRLTADGKTTRTLLVVRHRSTDVVSLGLDEKNRN